jgi:hypothetical protein
MSEKDIRMFDEERTNRTIQRGMNEAFACQDMLSRAPAKRSPLARAVDAILDAARSLTHHVRIRLHRLPSILPHARVKH